MDTCARFKAILYGVRIVFGIVIALQATHVKAHALGHTVVIWNMVSGGWCKQFCSLVLECSLGMQIRSFAHGVVDAKLSNKCSFCLACFQAFIRLF